MKIRILVPIIIAIMLGNFFSESANAEKKSPKPNQIQLVYVETPSSANKTKYLDTEISDWVSQIQIWLKDQVGRELNFKEKNSTLEIHTLKFSSNFLYKGNWLAQVVTKYKKNYPKDFNLKTLVFVIDQEENVQWYCGWAPLRSNSVIALTGNKDCFGDSKFTETNNGLSAFAQVILHELIHSFGSRHVCGDNNDLMFGLPECKNIGKPRDSSMPITFDINRNNYFGGNESGVDISKLKFWKTQ